MRRWTQLRIQFLRDRNRYRNRNRFSQSLTPRSFPRRQTCSLSGSRSRFRFRFRLSQWSQISRGCFEFQISSRQDLRPLARAWPLNSDPGILVSGSASASVSGSRSFPSKVSTPTPTATPTAMKSAPGGMNFGICFQIRYRTGRIQSRILGGQRILDTAGGNC